MRFVMMTEARTPRGYTHQRRWHEVIEEAVYAEEMGFDTWGCSEHHFFCDVATTSTPSTLFAAVAMKTSRIRLRHLGILMPIHHPVHIAERLSAVDVLSNGRVELGVVRGNTLLQLDGFGIPLDETEVRTEEALEIVVNSLSEDTFSYDGEYWKVPLRSLTPRPVQTPHPPIYKVCQSASSAEKAGARGLGAWTSDMYLGWEYLQEIVDGYKRGAANPTELATRVPIDSLAVSVFSASCAETNEEAIRRGEANTLHFAKVFIGDYPSLGARSSAYDYTRKIAELSERADDIHFLRTLPPVLVGDPDHWISTIGRYQEMGFDEVVMIIDGDTHEEQLRNIAMIGRYVIPHFKNPGAIVRHGPVTGADEFQYTSA